MRIISIVCLSLVLLACSEAPPASSQKAKSPDVVIDVIGEALPPLTTLGILAEEYYKDTGVRVNIHPYEFESAIQKAQLDFLSPSPQFELVMGIFYNYGKYSRAGFITPFDSEQFKGLQKVDGDSFYPALREKIMDYDGRQVGFPFSAQTMFLWFRKDIFSDKIEQKNFVAKYGYSLPLPDESKPLTWKQYFDIAEFFTRKPGELLAGQKLKSDFYGNALQMKRHPASFYEFTNFLFSFGGGFFDASGKPALNSEQNIQALKYYIKLKRFAPPGVLQATHDDALAQMQQGKVAMTIMWSDAPSELYKEDSSLVVDKVGYSLVPVKEDVGRKVAVFGGWGFLINAKSKHQEESFKFVQWVSRPEQQLKWAKLGGLPSSKSIFKDSEYMSIPYMPAQNEALKNIVSFPRDPNSEQLVNDGTELLSAATSEQLSPESALLQLQERALKLYGFD